MDGILKFICSKCGKELDGVVLDYKTRWLCSNCADDKSEVLHCERGSKVKAVNLDAGWDSDSQQAHKLLSPGQVYEVESLRVGGRYSTIQLKEFPGVNFNSVHFVRCQ